MNLFRNILKKVLLISPILLLGLSLFGVVPTQAQGASDLNFLPYDCLVPTTGCDSALSDAVIQFLFSLAPVLATLVLIWGGYLYFLGGFDQKTKGRQAIQAAVIGYVIIILAYGVGGNGNSVILNFIRDTLDGSSGDAINSNPARLLIENITNFLRGIAAVFAVLVIIWGGYKYFFSTLPGQKEDGKDTISNGIIGLVVILISTPIINLVTNTFTNQTDQLGLNPQGILDILTTLINGLLIPVSAVITVFFLVWGGFDFITAGGDQGRLSNARKKINNALVGLIIVLLAVTISQLIVFFVGNFNLGGDTVQTTTTFLNNIL